MASRSQVTSWRRSWTGLPPGPCSGSPRWSRVHREPWKRRSRMRAGGIERRRLQEVPAEAGRAEALDDALDPKLDNTFGADELSPSPRVPVDVRFSRQLKRVSTLEVDEQQPRARVHGEVAQGLEHVVARIIGEHQQTLMVDPDKSRRAATVRSVGACLGVQAGDEEGVGLADPAPLLYGESVSPKGLLPLRRGALEVGWRPRLDVLRAVGVDLLGLHTK